MKLLPRGIAPELLLSQIKSTAPYLFEGLIPSENYPPAQFIRDYDANPVPTEELSHFEYYRLCLSAHYSTCATPVPTDVDNQIRRKLWPAKLPLETALEMADLILASRKWDFTLVTRRYSCGARGTEWENEPVHGHLGEWFTVACGAYCALGQYSDPAASEKKKQLFEEIGDEVRRHSEIFGSLWRAKDGFGCLKASASLAHNFGDLDRVMDMWDLTVNDPLRLEFYKLGIQPFDANKKLRYLGRLWVAGELYKSVIDGSSMALENHRHYALRKPKALRRHPDLMITTGPFFDDWGRRVARFLARPDGSPSEETLEVFDALVQGWDRQPKTLGYGRALRGMIDVHSGLSLDGLKSQDPRVVMNVTQERLEKRWSEEALKLMDDIPSRA